MNANARATQRGREIDAYVRRQNFSYGLMAVGGVCLLVSLILVSTPNLMNMRLTGKDPMTEASSAQAESKPTAPQGAKQKYDPKGFLRGALAMAGFGALGLAGGYVLRPKSDTP